MQDQLLLPKPMAPVPSDTLGLDILAAADRSNHHVSRGVATTELDVVVPANTNRLGPEQARQWGSMLLIGDSDLDSAASRGEGYVTKQTHETELGEVDSDLSLQIDQVRWMLAGLSGRERDVTNVVIGRILPFRTRKRAEQYLDEQEAKGVSATLIDWLTERPSEAMAKQGAPKDDILKAQQGEDFRILTFLRAHKRKLADRQARPEFTQSVQMEKKFWKSSIQELTQEGWFHPSSAERSNNIDSLPIYEGDLFSTILKGRAGYFQPKTRSEDRHMVLRRGGIDTAAHEFNHAELQVRPTDPQAELNYIWLFESITEEVALATKGGFYPGQSNLQTGSYPGMRGLVRDVLHIAGQKGSGVDYKDLTYAYSSPELEQAPLMQDINQRLQQALGTDSPDVIKHVHSLYLAALVRVKRKNPTMKPFQQQDLAARSARADVRLWLDAASLKGK